MKIGDEVTVTRQARVLESHVTYQDKGKSCGYVNVIPERKENGHILGFHSGWFFDYWIIALNSGEIIRV